MKYKLVVCGGTFDHFHKGHKEFLRYALSVSSKVLIGLTTDAYIKDNKVENGIEDYKTRKQSLESFLERKNVRHIVKIEPINNIFIPKIWETMPIESIIVSKNTYQTAKKVNSARKEQVKYPLKIEIVPLVKSEDNEYISSSRIRNGEINREGMLYVNPSWFKNRLLITDRLRRYFKKPFGTLLNSSSLNVDILKRNVILGSEATPESLRALHDKGDSGQARMTLNTCLITVGDVTTKNFNSLGFNQSISVVDFKVARKKRFSDFFELGFSGGEKIIKITNPAGCLTPDLFKTASQVFKLSKKNKSIILQIHGEEDLAVLPFVLALPLESLVFYGQPSKGVVRVEVSEETKKKAYNFVNQFKIKY